MSKSPAEIIEQKGGAAVFAKAVGKQPTAVRLWKFRGQFPRAAWPEISRAFPDLTQDVLLEIESGR